MKNEMKIWFEKENNKERVEILSLFLVYIEFSG